VGAYGGRKEIIQLIAPVGPVYQAGTLAGNPVAMTAGIATLTILKQSDTYPKLEKLAHQLADGIKQAAESAGVPIFQTRVGSMLGMFFTSETVVDWPTAKPSDTQRYAKFFHEMLSRGSYFAPSQFEAAFVSQAHRRDDIANTIESVAEVFRGL
jgi:glutamate-1-semialdehyde 2,1-aminomutase